MAINKSGEPGFTLLGFICLQNDAHTFSRKNPDVKPFETGGEVHLEFFCNKSNCSVFLLGSHSKKRPHNITMGRLYDFHFYDALELGVENYQGIKHFKGAGTAQVGNKVSLQAGLMPVQTPFSYKRSICCTSSTCSVMHVESTSGVNPGDACAWRAENGQQHAHHMPGKQLTPTPTGATANYSKP